MSNQTSVLKAVRQMAHEKTLTEDQVQQLVEQGIHAALKKHFGGPVQAEIDITGDGDFDILVLKEVVEDVTEPSCEVSLEEARFEDPSFEAGDLMEVPVSFKDLGRHAVGAAKQRIVQGVVEEECEQIRAKFADRIGEVVHGEVQRVERNKILVMVDGAGQSEAFIPRREQNPRERFRKGEPIRAVLIKLEDTPRGPRLILSRAAPQLVAEMFGFEVPEIHEGIVTIRAIAREAGGRTKVVVSSADESVDAVGACVGMRGSRVQAVVSELAGERIDVIPWHTDPEILVERALAPADVEKVIADPERHTVTAIIADDQLPLAIGRGGQNVRLASDLVGWKIDLYPASEWFEREMDAVEASDFPLSELGGISDSVLSALQAVGITTFFQALDMHADDLEEVPGITRDEAESMDALLDELTVVEDETSA